MAEEIQLTIKPRTVLGKQVHQLRRDGWVPLGLYGAHIKATPMQAEERALRQVLLKAGHNRLIYLDTGDGQPHIVVAREIQREPISGRLLHVDLQEISLTEKMMIEVPVVLVGTSPAVTRGEGLLIHGVDLVTVRVLPTDLIPEIDVDVSILQSLNQTIHVSDLRVSEKMEILTHGDEMIAKIIPVKEEVIAVEAPTAAMAEVEVVGKGKKEEEGAEEPEAQKAEPKKEEKK